MVTAKQSKPHILMGKSISPGLAEGLIHVHHNLLGPIDIPRLHSQDSIENELSRLDTATESISDDLLVLAARVEKQIDARLAEVFSAHQLMVKDTLLRDELRKEIVQNLISASSAVKIVIYCTNIQNREKEFRIVVFTIPSVRP